MAPRKLTSESLKASVSPPSKRKGPVLTGAPAGPGGPRGPMGPCIGTENEELYWKCFTHSLQGATSSQPTAQTKDKELLCERGGLQWPPPLISHSPRNNLFLFIGTIWTEKLALLSPGRQPCLLKSEFHLACAKWELQG